LPKSTLFCGEIRSLLEGSGGGFLNVGSKEKRVWWADQGEKRYGDQGGIYPGVLPDKLWEERCVCSRGK